MKPSPWRYGCDKQIEVDIPTRYSYRTVTVRCGSTAHDGGVNQCDECAERIRVPLTPEYGDDI